MSVESYVRAMPKVELHIHLEGAMQKNTLLLIAEQNEISENLKHFDEWIRLLDNPDFSRLDEIVTTVSSWLQQPEDITRIVYDLGVKLKEQNILYAEVSVNPALYTENGITFEQFLAAINDGRDRVERAWGVHIAWILTIPRDQPRKADDILRWATSASSRKGGVVALGLSGREDIQPIGQFERAFGAAEKKELPRAPHAGNVLGAEGILEVIHNLAPNRIYDGWGSADAPDVLKLLVEGHISLNVSLGQAVNLGWVSNYSKYPLRALYDDGVVLTIGADMPSFYKTTLTDEYLAVVEHCDFSVEELEELVLNAVRTSFMSDEDKEALLEKFTQEYTRLRAEHIAPQMT
jgi:aminodeoxyfutalosine deaminase